MKSFALQTFRLFFGDFSKFLTTNKEFLVSCKLLFPHKVSKKEVKEFYNVCQFRLMIVISPQPGYLFNKALNDILFSEYQFFGETALGYSSLILMHSTQVIAWLIGLGVLHQSSPERLHNIFLTLHKKKFCQGFSFKRIRKPDIIIKSATCILWEIIIHNYVTAVSMETQGNQPTSATPSIYVRKFPNILYLMRSSVHFSNYH